MFNFNKLHCKTLGHFICLNNLPFPEYDIVFLCYHIRSSLWLICPSPLHPLRFTLKGTSSVQPYPRFFQAISYSLLCSPCNFFYFSTDYSVQAILQSKFSLVNDWMTNLEVKEIKKGTRMYNFPMCPELENWVLVNCTYSHHNHYPHCELRPKGIE